MAIMFHYISIFIAVILIKCMQHCWT